MNRLLSVGAAAVMAGGLSVASIAPAEAAHFRPWWPIGIGIAAGVTGFVVGETLAHEFPVTWHGTRLDWTSHANRCDARFRTYDRLSDTYVGYDGQRHLCRI
jgi:hypothetical protein